jgi:hypothetical protein
MGTAIDVRGSRFLVSTSGPDHMYHLPLHQNQLSEHAGIIGGAWGGCSGGSAGIGIPNAAPPALCHHCLLRAKTDAMAFWDDMTPTPSRHQCH